MRRQWAEAFSATAEAYWTEERTAKLLQGKRPIVRPRQAPLLLRALGLLHRDASMPDKEVRKYRQINHMLAVLQPSMRRLMAQHDEVRILDLCCGRSYLGLLLAWAFSEHYQHKAVLLGVDRREELIGECRRRSEAAGLDHLISYATADLADLEASWRHGFGEVHAVVGLHACDVATDLALGHGVAAGADVIAVAPCCQAELARGWAELAEHGATGPYASIWASPHLRRAVGADVTDAMRVLLLRSAGYDASAIEFVPSTHTPKNTLIRAYRTGVPIDPVEYEALRDSTGGVGITLEHML